ncbi:MAG: hypothetical protein F6K00_04610 [Leptolyngbya sp. SIOISBB]|nr:hypothetical protein [Leptolyngbya sp. SIOISBB]
MHSIGPDDCCSHPVELAVVKSTVHPDCCGHTHEPPAVRPVTQDNCHSPKTVADEPAHCGGAGAGEADFWHDLRPIVKEQVTFYIEK